MAARRSGSSRCWLSHHIKTRRITLGQAPAPLGCASVGTPVALGFASARPDLQKYLMPTTLPVTELGCPIAGSFERLRNGSASRVMNWMCLNSV